MNENSPTPRPSDNIGPGSVSATRTGTRTYIGRNGRGSEVLVGPVEAEGHFTPGELLKIALAGCAGMSADRVISRRLGDDFQTTVWAHGVSDPAEERYRTVDEEILLELDGLTDAEIETLRTIIGKAIDKACTVGRSVKASVEVTTTVNGQPVH